MNATFVFGFVLDAVEITALGVIGWLYSRNTNAANVRLAAAELRIKVLEAHCNAAPGPGPRGVDQ